MKLNAHALRALVGKLDDNFAIGPESVQDVLVYADICIDVGKKEIAKKLILRFVLDRESSTLNIENVKQKYKEKFGEDALQPSV